MSPVYAAMTAIGICLAAAGLEGLCAGKNVKSFYAELRFPRYSAPLWIWTIIGGAYYLIFGFVLYRLSRIEIRSVLWTGAFTLVVFMMLANALTNYLIFRARNLALTFLITCIAPFMDATLFLCLLSLDKRAAWSLAPYLVYRAYSVWWAYGVWKLNRPVPTAGRAGR